MKQCCTPPEGCLATKTNPPGSHPQEKPSPSPLPTNPCMCEDHILSTSVPHPVLVSVSFTQAPETSIKPTAMQPMSNYQIPASSASLNDNSFRNRSCQPSQTNVASTSNSLDCSFNTAVFSPFFLEDSFPEASTVIPPTSAHATSTPKTCGTSRPLLTEDLLNSASSRIRTQSSPCQLYQECPRS